MNLVEYEAKDLLRRAGLPLPWSQVLQEAASLVIDHDVVLKAQTPFGGRGKQGLILPAGPANATEVLDTLRARMRSIGLNRPAVLAETRVLAEHEYYLAWTIDDVAQDYVLLFTRQGGIHVEDHGATLLRLHFAATVTPLAHEFVAFFQDAGVEGRSLGALCRFATSAWRVFVHNDAQLLEINPLAVTMKGDLIALDAKVVLDDNARPRHLDWSGLHSEYVSKQAMSDLERRADAAGFTLVELQGETAILAGGAGTGMALLDLLADEGIPAANFVDASGGSAQLIFEQLGRLVFERARHPDVTAILMYFSLSATSLASVVNGLLKLFDEEPAPKPLVIGLLTSGAAEREMSHAQAAAALRERGYGCERDLPAVMQKLRELRDQRNAAEALHIESTGD